jgi:hypothetical protein
MAVTPTGARHRITALFALGWSPAALSAETGLDEAVFALVPSRLAKLPEATLERVGSAYDALWNRRPPERTPAEREAAAVWREHANDVGWAPPLAWDDDTIDDPAVRWPEPGWRRGGQPGRGPVNYGGSLVEDIEFLRETGYRQATPAQLAVRLGMTKDAVATAMRRDRQRQQAERGDWEAEAG